MNANLIFVVVNPNTKLNNINNNINNNPSTTLKTNGVTGSTKSYSNKLFYNNIQIVFGSIGIILKLFQIIFINVNRVFICKDDMQSHCDVIYHYIVGVLLCMVLNGLILTYCITIDKIIDNFYCNCQSDEPITQPLQVNIDDRIVNRYVFCWNNCILFIIIEVVSVDVIYLFDAMIYCLHVLKYFEYLLIQLVDILNCLLLLVCCVVIAIILRQDTYQSDYITPIVHFSFCVSFQLKLLVLFATSSCILSQSYCIVAESLRDTDNSTYQSDDKFAAKTSVDEKDASIGAGKS